MATNPFRPSRATNPSTPPTTVPGNPFAPGGPLRKTEPEPAVGAAVSHDDAVGEPDGQATPANPAVGLSVSAVGRLHEAVGQAMAAIRQIDPDDLTADDALQVVQDMRQLTGAKSPGQALDKALKNRLWALVGKATGTHKTPGGVTFKFRRGSTKRRATNFTALETDFPEAYRACVTETTADPDSPASLYL